MKCLIKISKMKNKPYLPLTQNSLLLILILLLGLFLRTFKLEHQSFWLDEYYNICIALGLTADKNGFELLPPGYFILLKSWLQFFPVNEVSARLPGAIVGSFSILAFYFLAKEMFNRTIGLWASFFMAISALHVDYCQEAKYYPLMLLFAIVTQLEYIKILKYRRKEDFLYFTVFSAIGLYVYYYLGFLFIIQLIHALIFFRKEQGLVKKIFFCQMVALATALPLIIHILYTCTSSLNFFDTLSWLKKPTLFSLADTTLAMLTGQSWVYGPVIPLTPSSACNLYAIFFIVCAMIAFRLKNQIQQSRNWLVFLALWLFLPVAFFYLFSLLFVPFYHLRYLLFSLPAFFLLFAWLVDFKTTTESIERRKDIYVCACTIGFLYAIYLFYLFFGHQLVTWIYYGKASLFFKGIITGQDSWPLESYLAKADRIFSNILICVFFILTILIPQKKRITAHKILLVLLFTICNTSSLLYYFKYPVRTQLRETAEYISQRANQKDRVLLRSPHLYDEKLLEYYFNRFGVDSSLSLERTKKGTAAANYNWIVDKFQDRKLEHNLTESFSKESFLGVNLYKKKNP